MVFDTIGKNKITNKLEGRTEIWSGIRNSDLLKFPGTSIFWGKEHEQGLRINIDYGVWEDNEEPMSWMT